MFVCMRPMRILFVCEPLAACCEKATTTTMNIHMYVHECICKLEMLCQFSHCTTILFLVSYIHMFK